MLPFDRQDRADRPSEEGAADAPEPGERLCEGGGVDAALAGDPAARKIASGRAHGEARGAWLLPPLMLAAIAAGALFVFRGPDQIFGVVFGLVLALGIVWILISTLLPARADRTCPLCGREGLVRLDSRSTQGLSCRLCSWRDESASAFLLAEEEGSFEDAVLRERGRGDGRRW